jgi:hypothetical protein
LQVTAIRTSAIVCPKAVEIGGADKEPDIVAGTKHVAGIVLEVGGDDVVFLWCFAVVAIHIDVADAVLTIAFGGHIDIGARILCSSEEQAGRVVPITEDKTTDVFSAHRCLGLTGREKKRGKRNDRREEQ